VQNFLVGLVSSEDSAFQNNLEQYAVGFIGALGLLLTIVQFPGGIGQQIRWATSWLAGKPFDLHLLLHPQDEGGPGAAEGSSVRA
jgi:hypothetical protein